MKNFRVILLTILALSSFVIQPAFAAGFKNEKFTKIFYFYGASGKGSLSGRDAGNAKAIADGDIWAIPAGTVVENVYVIIDTALTGTTDLDVGDDDDPDGWVDGSLSLTLGTPGMYSYDAKFAGAYKRIQTSGVTSPNDIYVVPRAKYYSAAGKEIKLDNTTTNTGGAFRVVIEGFSLQ